MEAVILRDELHSFIDALPDRSLSALRPLLSFLTEPDSTDEENAMIEESLAEYRVDPSSVTPWRKVRRGSSL